MVLVEGEAVVRYPNDKPEQGTAIRLKGEPLCERACFLSSFS
jgi:hypothetical protein